MPSSCTKCNGAGYVRREDTDDWTYCSCERGVAELAYDHEDTDDWRIRRAEAANQALHDRSF